MARFAHGCWRGDAVDGTVGGVVGEAVNGVVAGMAIGAAGSSVDDAVGGVEVIDDDGAVAVVEVGRVTVVVGIMALRLCSVVVSTVRRTLIIPPMLV